MADDNKKEVLRWTCKDVGIWLKKNGFEYYIELLTIRHKIDGKALLLLNENDLRLPPMEIKILGDLKRLWFVIHQVQKQNDLLSSQPNGFIRKVYYDQVDSPPKIYKKREANEEEIHRVIASSISSVSETWRTCLSVLYAFMVFCLTAFVMTVVHDRVPDMKKYPPLPDIILDSVPLIPWAFKMCEFTGIVLGSMWLTVLCLHKHRMILLRRMAALFGTVFLLRCVTMFVTSLSVPGVHLECSGKVINGLEFNVYIISFLKVKEKTCILLKENMITYQEIKC